MGCPSSSSARVVRFVETACRNQARRRLGCRVFGEPRGDRSGAHGVARRGQCRGRRDRDSLHSCGDRAGGLGIVGTGLLSHSRTGRVAVGDSRDQPVSSRHTSECCSHGLGGATGNHHSELSASDGLRLAPLRFGTHLLGRPTRSGRASCRSRLSARPVPAGLSGPLRTLSTQGPCDSSGLPDQRWVCPTCRLTSRASNARADHPQACGRGCC